MTVIGVEATALEGVHWAIEGSDRMVLVPGLVGSGRAESESVEGSSGDSSSTISFVTSIAETCRFSWAFEEGEEEIEMGEYARAYAFTARDQSPRARAPRRRVCDEEGRQEVRAGALRIVIGCDSNMRAPMKVRRRTCAPGDQPPSVFSTRICRNYEDKNKE